MARPATTWARGAGERTDLDAPDCAPEDCPPVAALAGTVWLGDGDAVVPAEIDCPDEDCVEPGGGGGGAPVANTALLKPRPLWSNGYETEGQVARMGQNPATPAPGDYSVVGEVTGGFTFIPNGGRDDGGHVETVASGDVAEGNYMALPLGLTPAGIPASVAEAVTRARGHHHAWNLKGLALAQNLNVMGWGSNTGAGRFFPKVVIQVGMDRFVRAMKVTAGAPPTLTQLGATSTFQVPATGWFAIDGQAWAAPIGNDAGGFCIARYYAADQPPEGVDLLQALGVDLTDSVGLYGLAWGSEVVRGVSGGVTGIGVDDSVAYGNYGAVQRWLGDSHVGAAVPAAAGDETNSVIDFDSLHDVGDPLTAIGASGTHGAADRWANVTGTPARPATEQTAGDWWFGQTSIFTGAWLYGPLPYNVPNPDVSPLFNTPAAGAIGAIPRNTFYDAAGDLYRVAIGRANVADVEGLMPYARSSMCWVQGRLGTGPEARDGDGLAELAGEAPSEEFAVVSLHRDEGIDQSRQANFRPRLKSGGVEATLPVVSATRASFGLIPIAEAWQTILGYAVAPYSFLDHDPATLVKFDPAALPSVQVGAAGDFTAFDAFNPGATPAQRWIQFDLAELGFDYVYHPTVVTWDAPPPAAPRAGFLFAAGTDLPTRHVVIAEASTDWDGVVVSASVDWGDGSPAEPIALGGTLAHDYAVPGTYTITLTATDDTGLTGSVSHDAAAYVVNQPPVADFSVVADPGDPTNQTADFTDHSTDDGVVSAWDWDFGDGSPHSALQNPVHVYAAPGTYHVVLTVTDNGGEAGQPPLTDSVSADVTVPFRGGGAGARVAMAPLFTDSMGAGLHQSSKRYDFTNAAEVVVAGGGRDGKDAIKENSTTGTWQRTFEKSDPHAFQFGFDLRGQALPAKEVPLFVVGLNVIGTTLTPAGKVRVYAYDGAAWVLAAETAAAVPGTGPVVGQLRFKFGAIGVGNVYLRINGESLSADPIAVNPGQVTMLGDLFTFGTGSAGNYFFTVAGGFAPGLPETAWFDIACLDDSGVAAAADWSGDVHFDVCTPQAMGTFNDTGAVVADLQTADEGTSGTTFTALGQKTTCTVNTPGGVLATILAVLPFYEAIRGGASVTRTLAVLLKSGATLAQSPNVAGSSSYTASYFVNPSDTIDQWILTQDPATAAAWANAAAVGATEVGLTTTVLGAGGTIILSQLGLEVAYWDS